MICAMQLGEIHPAIRLEIEIALFEITKHYLAPLSVIKKLSNTTVPSLKKRGKKGLKKKRYALECIVSVESILSGRYYR